MAFEFPAIDPIALSIGPLQIRWYALAYLAGFLLGWRYALSLAGLDPAHRPSRPDIDDFLPWAILGVILGGRLGYVLFYNLPYYMENPLEALMIWQGGMAFHGGALGVITAMAVYALARGLDFLRLSDIVCCAVPVGLFFGRIANFVNGELYGRVTDAPWGVIFPHAGPVPRHPSQLYEAALEGAILFLILYGLSRFEAIRNRPGILAGIFLTGYGIFRALVEYVREPDAHLGFILGPFSMGQILSLPMVIIGFGVIAYALRRSKSADAA